GRGWEEVTDRAIEALVERRTQEDAPLVAVLWGRDAQSLAPRLRGIPCVSSPHPSPLSASRGFFGSRPFSRTNALLEEMGAPPVDWRLEAGGARLLLLRPSSGALRSKAVESIVSALSTAVSTAFARRPCP